MPLQLVPLTAGTGPIIQIERPVLLVGRHPDCDVRVDLPQISRRHCCVAQVYDRVVVRDLGSRHGVFVNGEPIDEQPIRLGDEVAIGHLLYRLIDPNAPQPANNPAAARPVRPPRPKPPSLPELDMPRGDNAVPLHDLVTDL